MAIERKFVGQNIREFRIKKFVEEKLDRVGLSGVKLKKTPLGDKIIISASRPGLVVGRGGANIQDLTKRLREEFQLDNPQIEIEEVPKPDLDADIVAERILNSLERFGSGRTKGIGHKAMEDCMRSGALGVEIIISGKIPSMRARSWRFYSGYLKKAGDIAVEGVRTSIKSVTLKSGAVGIRVRVMPPDIRLPDDIRLTETITTEVEEVSAPVAETATKTPAPKTPVKEPAPSAQAKPKPAEPKAPKEKPSKQESAEKKVVPKKEPAAPVVKEVSASESKDSDAEEEQ